MNAPSRGGGLMDGAAPTPARPPSSRVRLEAALLDADWAAPVSADANAALPNERVCSTVLVVAAESDLRRYVRECLRERPALHVVEASTVPAALALAARFERACLVVDEPERRVLDALPSHAAVLLVDDVPRDASGAATRLRLLGRPFTARDLVAELDRLLG